MVEFLSQEQEKNIIQACINKESVGQGASRIVYQFFGHEINTLCGQIIMNDSNVCVVKIAIGLAGVNQNDNEVSLFLDYQQDIDSPLAAIYAYGEFVEIMTDVDTSISWICRDYALDEFDVFEEAVSSEMHNVFCRDGVEVHNHVVDAYETIEKLHNYLGRTSDNGQIGYDWNTCKWVAFDYGYITDSDRPLCSDLSDIIEYDSDQREFYLQDIVKYLSSESDSTITLEDLEQQYLNDFNEEC